MNRMRFGAVLVTDDGRIGFYLSHRAVLTVPRPGAVRAVSYEEFGRCRVFARDGVAVSCFDALMRAAETEEHFRDSLGMVGRFLGLPENADLSFLCSYMERSHGAVPEDFEIRVPHGEPDNVNDRKWRSEMENFDVKQEIGRAHV